MALWFDAMSSIVRNRYWPAFALALLACEPSPAPGGPPAAALSSAALVIDVREPSEFAGGHLQGAENIPVGQIESRVDQMAQKLGGDKTKPVVVYCQSGGRAGKAKGVLEQAGFTNVTNAGGYDQLKGAQ